MEYFKNWKLKLMLGKDTLNIQKWVGLSGDSNEVDKFVKVIQKPNYNQNT